MIATMSVRPAWLCLLLTVPVAAQDATWRLPERGAAEYRRKATAFSGVADSQAAAMKLEAKDAVPAGFLPRLVPAPWLCQGELTADHRAIADEPRDLRDVLRAVACDLRLTTNARLRYLRLLPFGDLVLTGRVEAPDAEGRQSFTLEVASADPEQRPGEAKAALQRFVRPLCRRSARGTVTVTRTWDAGAGVVRSYSAEMTLVFEEDKGRFRKLVIADEWDLAGVHENQDVAFREDVAKAIVDGTNWLKRELKDLGRPHLQDQEDGARSYGSGRIALALLTLLHADVPAADPIVTAAFDELRKRVLVDTYSLGVALMAMAARDAPPNEAEMLRSGALAAPRPRQLNAADKELAAEWLKSLMQNIDTRVDAGYRLRFNYTAGPRFDNSVTQYGLLGLFAAQLCQLEVPSTRWRAAAAHLMEVQDAANDRELKLSLTLYRDLRANMNSDGGKTHAVGGLVIPARGFAYQLPDRPVYGSMTAAGTGGLVIARAGLLQAGLGKADVMPKINAAIDSGFAWLAAEFSVRSNPGFVDRADDNWYYYLYGLERTCELAGVARIQGRDWYYEGALQLLAHQGRNGAFRTEHEKGPLLDATCFAVLFLKRASLGVTTGG
jgi:hypothetical protein